MHLETFATHQLANFVSDSTLPNISGVSLPSAIDEFTKSNVILSFTCSDNDMTVEVTAGSLGSRSYYCNSGQAMNDNFDLSAENGSNVNFNFSAVDGAGNIASITPHVINIEDIQVGINYQTQNSNLYLPGDTVACNLLLSNPGYDAQRKHSYN